MSVSEVTNTHDPPRWSARKICFGGRESADRCFGGKMFANADFQSPKRHQLLPKTFSVTPTHTPLCDVRVFPWSEGRTREGDASPTDSCTGDSPRTPDCFEREALRRGRPRADSIGSLIIEGSRTPGTIRCKVCSRNFPRGKSLQAHMRTHTGERPYICDFPDCGRAFCQSGQLRTHQRLHTGEKPFICSVEGCGSRFAHANRHCPQHPGSRLVRDPSPVMSPSDQNHSPQVLQWLHRHQQQERTPRRTVRCTKRSLQQDIENQGKPENNKACKRLNTSAFSAPLQTLNNELNIPEQYADMGVQRLEPDPPTTILSPRKREQNDRLIGAIALVELAHGIGL